MTMTLGTLIEVVENIWTNGDDSFSVHYLKPGEKYENNSSLQGIDEFYSWRGSYNDLCLPAKTNDDWLGIEQFLCKIRGALGATFTGYKGGEYKMSEDTFVWRAPPGQSNRETPGITHITVQDTLVLIHTKMMDTWRFNSDGDNILGFATETGENDA